MIWKIEKTIVKNTEEYENLIKRVYFSVSKNGDERKVLGDVIVNDPIGDFIPYSNLTDDDILNFVKNALGEYSVSRYESLAI